MKITENVHALRIPFEIIVGPNVVLKRFVYSYLICAEEVSLIDSGVKGSEKLIFDYLLTIGREPEEISTLILTHSHPDHIGASMAIKKRTGCCVAAHCAERAWIEDTCLQAKERPVPGFDSLVGGPVKVERILEDGDVLDPGMALSMRVLHTPGHSRGSVSLFIPEEKILICGDAIPLSGDLPIFDDFDALLKSIDSLSALDIGVLLSAWDEPRYGKSAYSVMDESKKYLETVQNVALQVFDEGITPEGGCFMTAILERLHLPRAAANPMVETSFKSALEAGKSQI